MADGPVRVELKLHKKAKSLQARLNGTTVTNRFRKQGDKRTATFEPGRADGLEPGTNRLTVITRGDGRSDVQVSRFVRVRRSPGFLSVSPSRLNGDGRLPVTLRVRDPRATVTASVNGRRLSVPARGAARALQLDGDDGLKSGFNRLQVRAYNARGAEDSDRRFLAVKASRPIPAIGGSRRATVGQALRLDGDASLAPGVEGPLRYRWTITKAPRGAKAKLQGAAGRTPSLTPDVQGEYGLRMTVAATGGRRAGAADSSTVNADLVVPPAGVPVDTRAATPSTRGERFAISLGAPIGKAYYPDKQSDAAQVLVLDRSSLEFVSNKSYAGSAAGMSQLEQDVKGLGSGELVVVTTKSGALPGGAGLASLNGALAYIGAASADGSSPYSAIGFSAAGAGTGTQNLGMGLKGNDDRVAAAGSLRGFLQHTTLSDGSSAYHYVSGDYAAFDTNAPGTSPTQAAIQVDGHTYRSDSLPAGQTGFFTLTLDAGSLSHVDDETYPVNGSPKPGGELEAMAGDLKYTKPDQLVFVQSIGAVRQVNPGWEGVGDQLEALGGGSPYIFGAVGTNTSGGYTQVGPPGGRWASSTKVASPAATGSGARLIGLLSRNGKSQFNPELAGPDPRLANDLPLVAYKPSVPWPMRDTPARNAAIACINAALDFPAGPIEDKYWQNENEDWDGHQGTLNGWSYKSLPSGPGCNKRAFAEPDFKAVQGQLLKEFPKVSQVLGKFIPNLTAPFNDSKTSAYAAFNTVLSDVEASANAQGKQASGDALGISGALLDGLALLFGEEEAGVGLFIGLMGAAFDVASATESGADGGPADKVTGQGAELGEQLVDWYTNLVNQTNHVGKLLVSDWGRLSTANDKTNNDWRWDSDYLTPMEDALKLSARNWAYNALVPLVYRPYAFKPDGDPGAFPCHVEVQTSGNPPVRDDWTYKPFKGEPQNGKLSMVDDNGNNSTWAFGGYDTDFIDDWGKTAPVIPSQKLVDGMFTKGDVGSGPPIASDARFYEDNYAARGTPGPPAVQPTTYRGGTLDGGCGVGTSQASPRAVRSGKALAEKRRGGPQRLGGP